MRLYEDEEIKDITGYEQKYAISSYGRVWSYDRHIWLSPFKTTSSKRTSVNNTNYVRVNLRNRKGDRKLWLVHILVASVYVPGRTCFKREVNHIDGNLSNNYKDNLEWVSHSSNMIHAFANGYKQSPDPYKYKRALCV